MSEYDMAYNEREYNKYVKLLIERELKVEKIEKYVGSKAVDWKIKEKYDKTILPPSYYLRKK